MSKKTVTMKGPAGLIEVSPEQVRRHVAQGYVCVEETVERVEAPAQEDEVQAELDLAEDEDPD